MRENPGSGFVGNHLRRAQEWCHHATLMPTVFMYGPDTVQGRMFDRVGPSTVVGPGTLDGFQLSFDKPNMKNAQEGLPNAAESTGHALFGLLFELTRKQIEILDGFFGGYTQKSVTVNPQDPDLSPRSAKIWLARRTKAGLRPSRAILELVTQGLQENEAGEPFLDAVRTIEPFDA